MVLLAGSEVLSRGPVTYAGMEFDIRGELQALLASARSQAQTWRSPAGSKGRRRPAARGGES